MKKYQLPDFGSMEAARKECNRMSDFMRQHSLNVCGIGLSADKPIITKADRFACADGMFAHIVVNGNIVFHASSNARWTTEAGETNLELMWYEENGEFRFVLADYDGEEQRTTPKVCSRGKETANGILYLRFKVEENAYDMLICLNKGSDYNNSYSVVALEGALYILAYALAEVTFPAVFGKVKTPDNALSRAGYNIRPQANIMSNTIREENALSNALVIDEDEANELLERTEV